MDKTELKRFFENYQEEINSAAIYRALSEIEKSTQLSLVYQKMAEIEEEHAGFWHQKLVDDKSNNFPVGPDWRTQLLIWLARRFGAHFILPTVIGKERNGSQNYLLQPETKDTSMPSEERSHERLLLSIAGKNKGGMEGGALAQLEGRHRAGGGNALRAAVLGANDGLVSNLSLVMGVAGAELSGRTILVTGLAGLLAGAASMALGEWLSVQSSRELYEHQLNIEKREIAAIPEEEEAELALIYQAKGLSQSQAEILAKQIMSDETSSLDTMAREELGIDPEELGGSAWEAAGMSFVLFSIGAIIPVVSFIFTSGATAVFLSLGLSAIGLFVIGAGITLLTGRNLAISGLRQVVFGLLAAGLTFGIGRLIGVSIGG